MYELLQECIRPVNLPYTLLFGLTLLYWIMYLFGVLGSDFLDFIDFGLDLGADIDLDVDLDADVDVDADVGQHGGALISFLKFLHAGDVPLTVIITCLTMSMWALSILVNYYLKNHNGLVALGLFIPFFVCSVLVTKVALKPFVPLIARALDETGDALTIIGKLCVVTSLEVTPAYGQAHVATKGSPIVINVKTQEGESLKKGDKAVVFDRDDEDETYVVTALEVDRFKDLMEEEKPLQDRAGNSRIPRDSGSDPDKDTKTTGED